MSYTEAAQVVAQAIKDAKAKIIEALAQGGGEYDEDNAISYIEDEASYAINTLLSEFRQEIKEELAEVNKYYDKEAENYRQEVESYYFSERGI